MKYMKLLTKLRLLAALYSALPVFAIVLAGHGTAVFYHKDFQSSLAWGAFTALLIMLFGHLPGVRWLFLRRFREIRRFCRNVRNGEYVLFSLPNEPTDRSDENELIALMRDMNWMVSRIRYRESQLKETVSSLEKSERALKNANTCIEKAMSSLWGEMELAKKIQTALQPPAPCLPGFEIAASLEPAAEVGGDYYDVISVRDRHRVVIGDVSGHGVPAGLIMMMAQTAIHTALLDNPNLPASELLAIINRALTHNIGLLGESKYMTMTVLTAEKGGRFSFAGLHQDLLIYRARTGEVDAVETRGMWLGLVDDVSDMMPDDHISLAQGDVMMLYTDGITEARDAHGEMFGEARLIRALREFGNRSAGRIHREIIARLDGWQQTDDVTLIVLKRQEAVDKC
ncbi:hypothetical protein DENIS_2844 [Desulfonema ishimotonii]|uniref:PPM-type phosphatase domain-containing protein n=1 Tax=Desulfonema ishimotonii TaxID=45657 RepID=A0A401FY00_9BACT|nr:PP2C family protein-serine/threonine phosphatase [Desulfonema ishimotonii]GBC61882.1 hypothetical protein DENIS_2844 [Desulfonema ishimotonii]